MSWLNYFSDEGRVAAAALFDLACTPGQALLQEHLREGTGFVALLVAGVGELVAQLPPVTQCPPFAELFRSNEAAAQLLERLRFIDALCQCGPKELTVAVCARYATELLDKTVTPMLMDVDYRADSPTWKGGVRVGCR